MIDAAIYYAPNAGVEYQLDANDTLWLGRSLAGECADSGSAVACAAVAWTMLTRWMLWAGPRHWKTFSAFIQDFSQPIDREWADPNSDRCRDAPDSCTAELIGRRQRYRSMNWGELPQIARESARAFARGELKNPVPGAVDFAAAPRVTGLRLEGEQIEGNIFLQPEQARGLPFIEGPVVVRSSTKQVLIASAAVAGQMAAMGAIGVMMGRWLNA